MTRRIHTNISPEEIEAMKGIIKRVETAESNDPASKARHILGLIDSFMDELTLNDRNSFSLDLRKLADSKISEMLDGKKEQNVNVDRSAFTDKEVRNGMTIEQAIFSASAERDEYLSKANDYCVKLISNLEPGALVTNPDRALTIINAKMSTNPDNIKAKELSKKIQALVAEKKKRGF